jgi:hypothetical protein
MKPDFKLGHYRNWMNVAVRRPIMLKYGHALPFTGQRIRLFGLA